MYLSSSVSFLPILPSSTSGRYQTCNFRRKNNFPASRTIRGKVTKPTHHHDKINLMICHFVRAEGSIPSAVEKTRAMSLGWFLEELRVMVLFILKLLGERVVLVLGRWLVKGFEAERE